MQQECFVDLESEEEYKVVHRDGHCDEILVIDKLNDEDS